MSQPSNPPFSGTFPTTRWSCVVSAGAADAARARDSLEELCTAYWYPIYVYIRRRGHDAEQARDLTQDFFVRLLEKGVLAEADPNRGRFRSFLRTVCAHFLANRSDWARAQKRGGGRTFLPLDASDAEARYGLELSSSLTPERIFDRSWALTLLSRVLDRLGREYDEAGKAATFQALRGMLAGEPDLGSYSELAARLGASEGAVRVAAHRLRRRYGELLRSEIAATLAEPAEVDGEIRELFAALEPE